MDKNKDKSFLDHFVEKPPQPQETPREAPAPTPAPAVDKKRNSALMRYIAILFIVAFALVLLSFILSHQDSQETISQLNQNANSALAKAEELQDNNRQLQADKEALQLQLEDLQAQLQDTQAQLTTRDQELATVTQEKQQLETSLDELNFTVSSTADAYANLAQAQLAFRSGDYETCALCLQKLEPLLDYLDQSSRTVYNNLIQDLETTPETP